MLVPSRTEVEALLDMSSLIDALGPAMADLSAGRASVPPRVAATVPPDGFLGAMPGHVPSSGVLMSKLVSVFPGNAGTSLPTHQAVVVTFDPATGRPAALLDGTAITAARTAAGSALSARLLARDDAAVLAILGTGVQARSHADAMSRVRPFREIRVAGRDRARAAALAAELRRTGYGNARVAESYEEAVDGADVVCATRVNMAFVLVADKLVEVNERLVQSPHVATIEIPLPDRDEREQFVPVGHGWPGALEAGRFHGRPIGRDVQRPEPHEPERRAGAGGAHRQAARRGAVSPAQENDDRAAVPGAGRVRRAEAHARSGRRPRCGQEAACKQDAKWIGEGRLESAPMGYLVCGPVGTGKTFLAECYAGSIGIPCVVLRNFRSKYVGETEGNLEQVLAVLRSLGPVVVIVDEADAALGNRQAAGDSGTSARVFSMIASQMGDTRYRGQIIWMLLTSRPDLLPIDLKRQGRAEVHIPLFYPHERPRFSRCCAVMAKKNKVQAGRRRDPDRSIRRGGCRGADLESIVLASRRVALAAGRDEVDARRSGAGARRVHPLGPGPGKGIARNRRRAGMYAEELPAAGVAGENRPARRPLAAAGAAGGDPAID